MPPGKKPLPLFELVTDRDGAARREVVQPVASSAPAAHRAPDFQPREPKPFAAERRVPRAAEAGLAHLLPGLGGKPVVIGSTALWLSAATALLIVFVVWIAGNAFGRRQAEQQFERNFGLSGAQDAGTQVPDGGAAPANPGALKGVQDPLNTRTGQAASPAPVDTGGQASPGAGQVLTFRGSGPDPRVSGTNYLLLGTLSKDEAVGAIQFFAKNGVETLGVPVEQVDRKSPRANTSPRFQLFAAKGFASSEFAARQLERDKLKQEIVRLGAIWKKDNKGSTTFSDAFWLKND